jgi:hypothetical protein
MARRDASAFPNVFIDRFLYRGLWKLVQLSDGAVCLVPTRRFVALVALFGRVGYPGDLLALHFRMAGSGVSAGNRSPYEIPAGLTVSFNVISAERTLPVLTWLLDEGALFPYEEDLSVHPLDALDALMSQARVAPETLAAWLEESLVALPDWRDKWRGSEEAMRSMCVTEGAPSVSLVIRAALDHGAYPAMFSPEASAWWCESLRSPLSPLAEVEARLCERLPDRLLSFPDLVELSRHPAARALRDDLLGRSSEEGTFRLDATTDALLAPVVEAVERLGNPYLDAVCGVVDSSRFAEPFGLFPECRSAESALEYLDETWPHVEHRAGFALSLADGARPELRLIHEYSCELWLAHLTQFDMQRTLAGDAPWGKTDPTRLLRPF